MLPLPSSMAVYPAPPLTATMRSASPSTSLSLASSAAMGMTTRVAVPPSKLSPTATGASLTGLMVRRKSSLTLSVPSLAVTRTSIAPL